MQANGFASSTNALRRPHQHGGGPTTVPVYFVRALRLRSCTVRQGMSPAADVCLWQHHTAPYDHPRPHHLIPSVAQVPVSTRRRPTALGTLGGSVSAGHSVRACAGVLLPRVRGQQLVRRSTSPCEAAACLHPAEYMVCGAREVLGGRWVARLCIK